MENHNNKCLVTSRNNKKKSFLTKTKTKFEMLLWKRDHSSETKKNQLQDT